jgi:hypothetical protein
VILYMEVTGKENNGECYHINSNIGSFAELLQVSADSGTRNDKLLCDDSFVMIANCIMTTAVQGEGTTLEYDIFRGGLHYGP